MRFEGKTVMITGAARGQGRSHAVRFAAEGADVILCDWDRGQPIETVPYPLPEPQELEQTAELVRAAGREALACPADVRDLDALFRATELGVERFGRIDVLVANAAICTFGPIASMSTQLWSETIDINLTGVF